MNESPEEFISGSQVEEDIEEGGGWTVMDCVEEYLGNQYQYQCNQVRENIWKAKNDTVRHCRRQRTVAGVGSTDIYG